MRTRPRFALVATLSLVTRVAFADPSAADRAQARQLAQEGQQAFEAKNYSTAIDRFTKADALVHAPTLLLGLARAQVGMGRFLEAQENYNRVVREGVDANAPKAWAKALTDAAKEVEAIAPRLAWVTITVLGPTNPEVVIDSRPVPVVSLGTKRPVNPGVHKFSAGAEGFLPIEKTVTLAEGESVTVNLELAQAPVEAQPIVKNPGGPGESESSANSVATRTTIGLVALGVGGAGLIAGTVTGLIAMNKASKLNNACDTGHNNCPTSEQGNIDSYHRVGYISTGSFILAGVGIATGAALLFTLPSRSNDNGSARITPFIGPGSAGVWGSF